MSETIDATKLVGRGLTLDEARRSVQWGIRAGLISVRPSVPLPLRPEKAPSAGAKMGRPNLPRDLSPDLRRAIEQAQEDEA